MNSLDSDVRIKALLAELHAASAAQNAALARFIGDDGFRSVAGSPSEIETGRAFWRDKLVALEPEKARFCYMLIRAMGARSVVEVGTSFGVSTLYLAAAVKDNGGGCVIATELEPQKAAMARAHFARAGLSEFIDLREGDLRQTLAQIDAPIDFVLMDVWTPMARAAIALLAPHLREGAVVVADNTETYCSDYADYFAFLADPANGFSTEVLPFDGGLSLSIKTGALIPAT